MSFCLPSSPHPLLPPISFQYYFSIRLVYLNRIHRIGITLRRARSFLVRCKHQIPQHTTLAKPRWLPSSWIGPRVCLCSVYLRLPNLNIPKQIRYVYRLVERQWTARRSRCRWCRRRRCRRGLFIRSTRFRWSLRDIIDSQMNYSQPYRVSPIEHWIPLRLRARQTIDSKILDENGSLKLGNFSAPVMKKTNIF